MLEILPIQDKNLQKTYCLQGKINYNADLMAYGAYVDGEIAGICQFNTKADGGQIIDLAPTDEKTDMQTLFVLGRATLNFIDLCGVHKAKFLAEYVDKTLIRSIGFKENDSGIYEVDLSHFFEHPCQHS